MTQTDQEFNLYSWIEDIPFNRSQFTHQNSQRDFIMSHDR